MAAEERVLCFPRALLEQLGVFQGISLDIEKYLPVLTAPDRILYLNRSDAEQDKRYNNSFLTSSSSAATGFCVPAGAKADRKPGCTGFIPSVSEDTSRRKTMGCSQTPSATTTACGAS
jgi:hypothetical protein